MSSLNFTHIKKTKKSIFQGVHYDKKYGWFAKFVSNGVTYIDDKAKNEYEAYQLYLKLKKNIKCKEYIPCVYVIESTKWKLKDGTKYYKIGRTNNPKNRLKQLKKHFKNNNLRYKLLFYTKYESIIENYIHKELKKYNIKEHPLSVELYNIPFDNIKKYFIKYQVDNNGKILNNISIYN